VAILQSWAPVWYDPATTATVRSAALPLMLVTAAVAGPWLRGMLNSYGTLQPSYAFAVGRPQGFDPGYALDPGLRSPQMLVEGTVARGRRQAPDRWPATTSIKIWATILGCIVAVAFVMYPYEAGGYFTILPHDSSQLNARVQGELTEVLVTEGEAVKPGQILGILSDWQQKYNLELNKAQLQSAQANLQHLLETPRPEDVELARKQYEGALARLPYDKAQFERYAALVTNDNVSRSNYDQVLSQYQQDQAAADVARANYDQVRVAPTQAQIDASRALVRQYTASVAFAEDELERTRIRATSYGTMVTQNPMLLRGKYFAQGALAFTVEDHKVLQADVQIPETDIDNVQLGGPVRLRFWGSPDKTFPGKAIAIAPAGQTPASASPQTPQSGSSNVIRVRALVPNPDGQLHTNTDGYAKIAGAYMPTWRAFGQMLQRFFLVEIWSWVP
jgi:multidrug resistance efflux pump